MRNRNTFLGRNDPESLPSSSGASKALNENINRIPEFQSCAAEIAAPQLDLLFLIDFAC
jgi:hypothetical protein